MKGRLVRGMNARKKGGRELLFTFAHFGAAHGHRIDEGKEFGDWKQGGAAKFFASVFADEDDGKILGPEFGLNHEVAFDQAGPSREQQRGLFLVRVVVGRRC